MSKNLKVLFLEDQPIEAERMVSQLDVNGFDVEWQSVQDEAGFLEALKSCPDLVLAEYLSDGYDAIRALRAIQSFGLDIPVIVIGTEINEELVVNCMKGGAADYLLRDHLERMGQAIIHALQEKQLREDRVTPEAALKENVALNHAILNSLLARVAVLDKHGEIISMNNAWEKFTGRTDRKWMNIGVPIEEVCRYALEADDSYNLRAIEGIRQVLDGNISLFALEYPDQNEELDAWYQIQVVPLATPEGGAVVTHQDITNRKQAEQIMHLQSKVLEAAANGILIEDNQGHIIWGNPAFTKMTGFTPGDYLGKSPKLIKSGVHDEAFYQELTECYHSGRVWQGEIINRRKDGSLYTEYLTVTPVLDEFGVVSHYVQIKQDISESKQHTLEMEAIARVASALRDANSRQQILPIVLDEVTSLLNVDGICLALLEDERNEMMAEVGRGLFGLAGGNRLTTDLTPSWKVIQTGDVIIVDDLLAEMDPNSPWKISLTFSAVGVPLKAQGVTLGALWVGARHALDTVQVSLLTAAADITASALFRARLFDETQRRLQRLTTLREIDKAIAASLDVRVTLNVLVDQITSVLGVHAADVLLVNNEDRMLEYVTGYGFRRSYTRTIPPPLLSVAQRAVKERKNIHLPNLPVEAPELHQQLLSRGENFNAYFAIPLISKSQVKGVLEVYARHPMSPGQEWTGFLETLGGQAAIAIDNAELFDNLQRSNLNLAMAYNETIEGWSRALDLRDRETEGHTLRVTEMTLRLARALGVSEGDLMHIRWGALLHDIGKMGIPDAVLFKPGEPTEEEWKIIRKHPQYAFELLSPIAFLNPALDIPYCHHERWDGQGYPRGLKGEQIPLAARIFSLVDVYDALVSDRPYREGWSPDRVLHHISEGAGTHFDPELVKMFVEGNW